MVRIAQSLTVTVPMQHQGSQIATKNDDKIKQLLLGIGCGWQFEKTN